MKDKHHTRPSRRNFVKQLLGAGASLSLAQFVLPTALDAQAAKAAKAPARPDPNGLSPDDHQFLNDLEKASVQYFWDQADPKTGLVKDRCNVHINDTGIVGSIAATGFGLSALCIGEQRGLSDEKLSTIVAGQRPVDLTREEAIAYDFASALMAGGVLPELTYRTAVEAFGQHGAAEGQQHEIAQVVAAHGRDRLDGLRHLDVDDAHDAFSRLLDAHAERLGDLALDRAPGLLGVEAHAAAEARALVGRCVRSRG